MRGLKKNFWYRNNNDYYGKSYNLEYFTALIIPLLNFMLWTFFLVNMRENNLGICFGLNFRMLKKFEKVKSEKVSVLSLESIQI